MNTSIKQPEGGLLQSQEWSDMLRAEGKTVVKITCSNGRVFGVVHTLPLVGAYLYVPRLAQEMTDADRNAVIQVAQQKHCAWVRMDLLREEQKTRWHGLQKAPHNMQPEENFIIPLEAGKEELLAAMKSKTRYNIRLAQKRGVEIAGYTRDDAQFGDAFDAFIEMVSATAQRKNVAFHKREHYRHMFTSLTDEQIVLYVARYDGEIIAANIVTFYGCVATYLHGGTSDKHRNVMAPFLLQWHSMCDAKERECAYYDFGGVYSETADPGKQGITRFKNGFAPHEQGMLNAGTYDVVLSPVRYHVYRLLQKLRNMM